MSLKVLFWWKRLTTSSIIQFLLEITTKVLPAVRGGAATLKLIMGTVLIDTTLICSSVTIVTIFNSLFLGARQAHGDCITSESYQL